MGFPATFNENQHNARVLAGKIAKEKRCPRCGYHGSMPYHVCTAPVDSVNSPKSTSETSALPPTASPDAEKVSEQGQISEKELQRQISQLLRLKGIWFSWSRTDKATRGVVGTPDFLFAIKSQPVAFECKVGNGKLSDDQERVKLQMEQNGWYYFVVRSTADAFEFVKRGLEPRRGRKTLNVKSTLGLTPNVERTTHSPLVPRTC